MYPEPIEGNVFGVFSPKLTKNSILFTLALQSILQIIAKVIFGRCAADHIAHLLKTPWRPQNLNRAFKAVCDLVLAYLVSFLCHVPITFFFLQQCSYGKFHAPL